VGCETERSILHGYLDGELDAARAAEFERHLLSCPECVRVLEAQKAIRRSIERANLYQRAPESLRAKVQSALPSGAPRKRFGLGLLSWQWLPAATVLALAVFMVWWQAGPRSGLRETPASAFVDAHLRSLLPGRLEDVVSTDQHTVKPWFDGKLNFAPPVRDFAAEGFPLEGGRLDVIRGRTVAVLVYGRRKHTVNVFVWPSVGASAKTASGSELGYNWMNWSGDGTEFFAVSDASAADLDGLRQLFLR
jgi:anti-sigma factor (TIGR02949 family)